MEIQIFENEQFGQLRGMTIEGEPWFVGKDVAQVLGYKDASKAVCDRVDKEDKTTLPIQQCGSNYKTQATFINESGLYALILSSKLPQAREFKRWVTAEVLPQIRRTGGYIPVKPEDDEKTILCKAVSILQRKPKETGEEKRYKLPHGRVTITESVTRMRMQFRHNESVAWHEMANEVDMGLDFIWRETKKK